MSYLRKIYFWMLRELIMISINLDKKKDYLLNYTTMGNFLISHLAPHSE